jgi:hypothetical protein
MKKGVIKLVFFNGENFGYCKNCQYQTFAQKPGESLDDCFARFESIVNSLRFCGPLAYSDNEHAKQLLYGLDDHVWGMKITTLEEFVDFATIDTEKLFRKIKTPLSHLVWSLLYFPWPQLLMSSMRAS